MSSLSINRKLQTANCKLTRELVNPRTPKFTSPSLAVAATLSGLSEEGLPAAFLFP
jgi:hypothetical protein